MGVLLPSLCAAITVTDFTPIKILQLFCYLDYYYIKSVPAVSNLSAPSSADSATPFYNTCVLNTTETAGTLLI